MFTCTNFANNINKSILIILAFCLAACASAPSSSPGTAQTKPDPKCSSGDCMNGYGTYEYKNGDRYVGSFMNGSRNGMGRYEFGGGVYYSGQWEGGRLIGPCKKFQPNLGEMIGMCADKDGSISFTEDPKEAKKRQTLDKLKNILNK